MRPKIGILGSSHSYGGNHRDTKDKSAYMVDSLQKHFPDYDFVTTAFPGMGSDRFLHCLTYLKTQHNIQYALIENVEDRKWKTVHYDNKQALTYEAKLIGNRNEMCDETLEKFIYDYEVLYTQAYEPHYNKINSIFRGIPTRKLTAWQEVCYIIYKSTRAKVEGVYNVTMTEKLCKQLDIIPMHWTYQCHPGRKSSHKKIKSCWHYFETMQGWSKDQFIGPDGGHLSRKAQDLAVEKYLKPIIDETVKIGNKL
jgi:hypothetical protein